MYIMRNKHVHIKGLCCQMKAAVGERPISKPASTEQQDLNKPGFLSSVCSQYLTRKPKRNV